MSLLGDSHELLSNVLILLMRKNYTPLFTIGILFALYNIDVMVNKYNKREKI